MSKTNNFTIKEFFVNHFDFTAKTMLIKVVLAVIFVLFAVGYVFIFGKVWERPAPGDFYLPTADGYTDAVHEGMVLTQEFTSPVDNMRGLFLHFDEREAEGSVMYVVTLLDENEETVFINDFNTYSDDSPVNILDVPLTGVKDKAFTLHIEVSRTDMDSAVTFSSASDSAFNTALINGEEVGAPLALQFNIPTTNGTETYTFVLVLLSVMICVLIFLFGRNIPFNTAVFVLAVGAFVAVLNPLGDVPDEGAHVLRAESVAQGKLFFSAHEVFEADAGLGEFMAGGMQESSNLVKFSDAHLYEIKSGVATVESGGGTAGNYFFFGYLGSALGVLLGTTLELPAMLTYYLGRILNVAFYAMLCTLAVALTPGFKRLFFVLAGFPGIVFLAASFSPDAITYGVGLLSVALLLRMQQKEEGKISRKCTAVYVGVATLMAFLRMTYICFLPLVLLFKKERYAKNNGKLAVTIQIACGVSVLALWSVFSGISGLRDIGGMDAYGQLAYIFQNPLDAFYVVFNTISEELAMLYPNFFKLGWGTYDMSWFSVVFPVFVIAVASGETPLNRPSTIKSYQLLLVSLGVLLATYLGMYMTANAVGSRALEGVQGRYFISLLTLLPLYFSQKSTVLKHAKYMDLIAFLIASSVLLAELVTAHYL